MEYLTIQSFFGRSLRSGGMFLGRVGVGFTIMFNAFVTTHMCQKLFGDCDFLKNWFHEKNFTTSSTLCWCFLQQTQSWRCASSASAFLSQNYQKTVDTKE
ncbi:CLUMA_CG019646, isoform A [Clunio marinus]|uniref:CLUMA_CG019646, isoform A n=1 Tax=Clunio marinus TaxID=568069 RepID=A0A1J1J343_9DIPT|nr:CLUMA_CG019646, isoform A [Clunio marinus]